MTLEDAQALRAVRAVLVRNWIDTSLIDFRVINGQVYIRGTLRCRYPQSISGSEETDEHGVSGALLLKIEHDLRGVPNVRGVNWDIEGWRREGGAWRFTGKRA